MKHIFYLTLLLTPIFVFCSFSEKKSRECHIFFDISPRCVLQTESEDQNFRMYYNEKTSFGLIVEKIQTNETSELINDSLLSWQNMCFNMIHLNSPKADSLTMNNIDLNSFSFECKEEKLIHHYYMFPAKEMAYKMKFSFPFTKAEKGRREMNKILESLDLNCH